MSARKRRSFFAAWLCAISAADGAGRVAEALERGVAVGARRVAQAQRGEDRQHLRLVEAVEIGSEIRVVQGLDDRLLGRPPVEQPPLGQPGCGQGSRCRA